MTSIAAEERARRRLRVWDLPTRLFHWCLVGLVSFALVTGLVAPKWWVGPRILAGYGIAILLAFRAVWAFYGPEYSRLSSFAFGPKQALAHLRGLVRLSGRHYTGHNPSGAMMIFALFGLLCLLVATGFLVQGGFEKQGPLAGFLTFAVGNDARYVHKALALLLIGLIALHLAGVLVGSRLMNERLIMPMITGWKAGVPTADPRPARPLAALLWLALLAAAVGAIVPQLASRPALGLPDMPPNAVMLAECGACHAPFHPSLLPRASWAILMAGLSDHFGEDASLPAAKRDEIAAYLSRYAAEAWDTKAAHRFAAVAPENPISITATPGWRRFHARLDPALFRSHAVGAPGNCTACHKDAGTGRFDPQAIAIPEG